MTQSEWVWDSSQIEEQRAVVKIDLGGDTWFMDWDDWELAKQEGREKPIIFGDKLILVDEETYIELEKLELWLKNNKTE